MATKQEIEAQLEQAQERLVKAEEENARLQARLNNIDADRPGATEEELREHRLALEDKDSEIAELKKALGAADKQVDGLKAELREVANLAGATEALAGSDGLKPVPVLGYCGKLPMDAGSLLTLAADVDGGGVMMVARIGDALSISYQPALKLAKKNAGYELQKRHDLR